MEASFSPSERLLDTPITRALDRALFWTLAALLVFGPLAFGATEPWSVAVLQSGAVLLLLLWAARQMAARAAIFQPSPLFLPITLFGATVTLQMAFHLSAYQYAAVVETMNYAAYATFLFVTVQ